MPVGILLVEPHSHVSVAFKRAIHGTKFKIVAEAETGETAIVEYKNSRGRLSLVVMDMIFPGLGGIKTMEQILKIEPNAHVVLVHDQKGAYLQMEATKKGAQGHLRYPFGSRAKVLEVLAIAEHGAGATAMGSDDHFVHVFKPVALTIKKKGIMGLLGKHSALSESLSINQVAFVSEKPFKEGQETTIEIRFAETVELVSARIRSVEKHDDTYKIVAALREDKEQRNRLRKLILDEATTE